MALQAQSNQKVAALEAQIKTIQACRDRCQTNLALIFQKIEVLADSQKHVKGKEYKQLKKDLEAQRKFAEQKQECLATFDDILSGKRKELEWESIPIAPPSTFDADRLKGILKLSEWDPSQSGSPTTSVRERNRSH
jgi:hypothetical protein